MPQNDFLKRYLDAGMAFTQLSRSRAEAIVKDLVKAGEVQRDQSQERVDELVNRSRKNTEQFMDMIRKEVSKQLSTLGFATKEDLAKLEARLRGSAAPAATKATASKATASKAAAPKKAATGSGGPTKASANKNPAPKKATTRTGANKTPSPPSEPVL